jgi:hypothetical protein
VAVRLESVRRKIPLRRKKRAAQYESGTLTRLSAGNLLEEPFPGNAP